MAFSQDSFIDTGTTLLENHTAEATWTKHSSYSTGSLKISSTTPNQLMAAANPNAVYYTSDTPPTGDYYGFTHKDGFWFIMQEDTDTGSFRYARGDSNFDKGWAKRENHPYDYFVNVF